MLLPPGLAILLGHGTRLHGSPWQLPSHALPAVMHATASLQVLGKVILTCSPSEFLKRGLLSRLLHAYIRLTLKIGMPIRLLRTLNPHDHAGTRLIRNHIDDFKFKSYSIEGDHANEEVTIPHIVLLPSDTAYSQGARSLCTRPPDVACCLYALA